MCPVAVEVEAAELQDRLVYCYPVRLATPSPPLPGVEMHKENNTVCVRYKGEMVKVSHSYFSKLVGGRRGPCSGVGNAWNCPCEVGGRCCGGAEGSVLGSPGFCFSDFSCSGCSTATAALMTQALSGSCQGSGAFSAGTRYGQPCWVWAVVGC